MVTASASTPRLVSAASAGHPVSAASTRPLVASASAGQVIAPALAARATAYWPMDASLPRILDQSGHGHHLGRDLSPALCDVPFLVGGNANGGQTIQAALAALGFYHRLLTPTQKAALLAGEKWPFPNTPSLRDASAYFLLDEPSNSSTYADATGRGNDLTKLNSNAILSVAGPLGTDKASRFGSAGANYLQRSPVTADLQSGNQPFTTCGWVNMDALGTTQQVFWGQLDFNSPKVGNTIYYYWHGSAPTSRFQCDYGAGIAGDLYRNAVVVTDAFGAPTTGVWYFLLCEYDPAASTLAMSVNGVLNSLTEVQRPPPRTSPSRVHFAVPPSFVATGQSGWDGIGSGSFVSASCASSADLSLGPNDKTFWAILRFDDTATVQTVMGKFDSVGSVIDWGIQQSAENTFFVTGDSAGNLDYVNVPLADNNYHVIVGYYDRSGDGKIHINLDNGAHVASLTPAHIPVANNLPFLMGACHNGSGQTQQMLGDVALAGISTGIPSQAEIAQLYSYGLGRYY